MIARRWCCAGFFALILSAQPSPAAEWQGQVGLQAHQLREAAAAGQTLVREQGFAPAIALGVAGELAPRWRWRATGEAWATDARYDGHSQSGAPLRSRTATQAWSLGARLAWQPTPSPWEIEAGVEAEAFRRRITPTGGYAGLDERLWQPRVTFGVSGGLGPATLRLVAIHAERGRLRVRFDNGLFDPAMLDSGRARGARAEWIQPLRGAWRTTLQAEWLSLSPSTTASLAAAGQGGVGTVWQPRWTRQRLTLSLQRRFE